MMKIVIVDDDRAAADALAQKLSTFDETQLCGIALNGMDGLRLVNETRPDVLFLDIELPDTTSRALSFWNVPTFCHNTSAAR